MSVKATTTVSIAPALDVGPQRVVAQHEGDPIPSGRPEDTRPTTAPSPSNRWHVLTMPSPVGVNTPAARPLRRRRPACSSIEGGGMSETPAPAPAAIHTSEDEQILHKLGYAQELLRAMGVFRNFAISFTIISILAGCLTSYYIAFQWGGPVAVDLGLADRRLLHDSSSRSRWPRSPRRIRRPAASTTGRRSSAAPAWGWFTGWFNLIGLIGIIAAVGYGLAIFATSFFNLMWDYPNDRHHIFYVFVGGDRARRPVQRLRRPHHVDAQRHLRLLARHRHRHHRRSR